MPSVVYYLVESELQGEIDVPSPRCASTIVRNGSKTCPPLGPSKRFLSKVNLARVYIWDNGYALQGQEKV